MGKTSQYQEMSIIWFRLDLDSVWNGTAQKRRSETQKNKEMINEFNLNLYVKFRFESLHCAEQSDRHLLLIFHANAGLTHKKSIKQKYDQFTKTCQICSSDDELFFFGFRCLAPIFLDISLACQKWYGFEAKLI